MTSRWFPPALGLALALVHFALIGYDYRHLIFEGESIDCMHENLHNDLACGTYRPHFLGHSADLGMNLPAYLAITLFYSLVNFELTDIALTVPGDQIGTSILVPLVWFSFGCSVRRMARRRWRPRDENPWSRATLWLMLPLAGLGLLFLLLGVWGLVASGETLQLLGFAFWILYVAALAAERLRVWPFAKLETTL